MGNSAHFRLEKRVFLSSFVSCDYVFTSCRVLLVVVAVDDAIALILAAERSIILGEVFGVMKSVHLRGRDRIHEEREASKSMLVAY